MSRVKESFSCTRVRQATRRKKHCGACSQCIDRRFGVLGANLGEYEPAETYEVDLFQGERKAGHDLTMAETYVLTANRLSGMSEEAFLANYGQTFRVLSYLPGSVDENARKVFELHKRHGQAVSRVVDREIANHATLIRSLTLPETSLLSLVVSPAAKQAKYEDPIESEPKPSEQAKADKTVYVERPIIFAINDDNKQVLFRGGIRIGGAGYRLIKALGETLQNDIDQGKKKESYRFTKADQLARALKIEEQTARQQISRYRKRIGEQFLENLGQRLTEDDVIENNPWHGYRLNPHLIPVRLAQLDDNGGD